ncbi:MAG: PDZ domain-containing protein [Planctomycetota bacterium]
MNRPNRSALLPAAALALGAALAAQADAGADPTRGLCRYPDVSQTEIVFVYANDLWVVPKAGGVARPVANPPGFEGSPRFSPDGKSIAFTARYDQGSDLYTLAVAGGVPHRVTHHPEAETLCDWSPDGARLVFGSNLGGLSSADKLYTVAATGGLPTQLPVPYGQNGALDKAGEWLAYTLHATDSRTWKRYRGGMATDIWLVNLKTGASKRITDWEGTDTLPMWHGRKVYFLSDRGAAEGHALNVWSHDVDAGTTEQVSRFTGHDVRWPAIGPDDGSAGEIVLQHGDRIHVLDLGTKQARAVDIAVPGDRRSLRVATVDVAAMVNQASISPSGRRVAVVARGDIWSAPAEYGTPRNLTRTDGVCERSARWSPDGKSIAYFADATGEYELYTLPADGRSDGAPATPQQITRPVPGAPSVFRTKIDWSPDAKAVVVQDKAGNLDLVTLADGTQVRIDTNSRAGQPIDVAFSHDSRWIAWSRGDVATEQSVIFLYDTKAADPVTARTQVTSGFYADSEPTFDRKGEWLVFRSSRHFAPTMSQIDTTWVYDKTEVLMAVPLRADVKLPWLPKSDEEVAAAADAAKADAAGAKPDGGKPAADGKDAPAPAAGAVGADAATAVAKVDGATDTPDAVKAEPAKADAAKKDAGIAIDLAGFEARAVQLPVAAGSIGTFRFNDRNELLYGRDDSLRLLDLADKAATEKTVVAGMNFQMSADGKKLLLVGAAGLQIADASAGATGKPIVTSPMLVAIDPRRERAQILADVWRIYRDCFYDAGMHGVDWPAIRRRYEAMLPAVVTREDLNYLLRELVAELNVGHAYIAAPGDVENVASRSVGMLGVEFAAATNADGTPAKAWRLAKFVTGAAFDHTARSPLQQHGLGVREGEYLLAVNGVPVDPARDPWACFLGLAAKPVTLTIGKQPVFDKDARDVVVTPIASEVELHDRAWIEQKRRRVDELSGGKVGYVYVPNTGIDGQNELVRQFHGQRTKPALLIDDRWNGGGQIPHRFIELLDRPITNYWAQRLGDGTAWPSDGHRGPKAMLINGMAGSGGDMFPWLFRHAGLGPLVGTRTWGGLVGYSDDTVLTLVDNGAVTVPSFAFYETDGTWGVEGHGVDPDVEVLDDPALMRDGGDPQLEKAVELLLQDLATKAHRPVPKPKGPIRTGMGVPAEDR